MECEKLPISYLLHFLQLHMGDRGAVEPKVLVKIVLFIITVAVISYIGYLIDPPISFLLILDFFYHYLLILLYFCKI